MSTMNGETKRILEMVESGRISAAEGARLLESTRSTDKPGNIKCPFCAEMVIPNADICPECHSDLQASTTALALQTLNPIGKFLVIYTVLITGFWMVSSLLSGGAFSFSPQTVIGFLLSALGMTAGIMLIKGNPTGWSLGILWSALQIVEIIVNYQPLNRQVLQLGANFHTNGRGLGINLLGIILLVLFIKAKNANPPAPQAG